MLTTVSLIIAFFAYGSASWLLFQFIKRSGIQQFGQTTTETSLLTQALVVAVIAVIAHITYAILVSQVGGLLNFSFSSMSVLISAILVVIYLIACAWMPIRRLGVLVYPFTILTLACSALWNSDANLLVDRGFAFNTHILVAILAYCLLTIATIQSLLYCYQEYQFKQRRKPSLLLALPPLQTMETLLFRLIGLGFVLLTFTLISGAIFSQQIFGHAFEFKHHTILAVVGWCVFAYLLIQRFRNGLRGNSAVAWTVCGFMFIQLGYFGTKLVTESLASA